jgi:hypothetical protein
MFIGDGTALDFQAIAVSLWTSRKLRLSFASQQIERLEAATALDRARPDILPRPHAIRDARRGCGELTADGMRHCQAESLA